MDNKPVLTNQESFENNFFIGNIKVTASIILNKKSILVHFFIRHSAIPQEQFVCRSLRCLTSQKMNFFFKDSFSKCD